MMMLFSFFRTNMKRENSVYMCVCVCVSDVLCANGGDVDRMNENDGSGGSSVGG